MPDWCTKNLKYKYRNREIGNTIIRKEIRQHKIGSVRQRIFTYLVHINEEFLTIDTARFFTAPMPISFLIAQVYDVSAIGIALCTQKDFYKQKRPG